MTDLGLRISKAFWTFNFTFGAYGFTRGFRTNNDQSFIRSITQDTSQRKMLLSERVFEGSINSIIYFSPFWNLYPLYRLFNRLEISIRGLNKDDYISYYKEPLSGYCFDTL